MQSDGWICLFDKQDGESISQWLGDGRAAYPISGMPYIEKDNICAMFDITEKKCEKLIFYHSDALENINWEDTDPIEQELDAPTLHVCHEGRDLLPLQTSDGITFIQAKYLVPLGDPDYMRLWGYDTNDPSFIYPSEIENMDMTYVPDYYADISLVVVEPFTLNVGGSCSNDADEGPFFLSGQCLPHMVGSGISSRIQKLPRST